MNNNINARYRESRVERDSQTQTQGYVSRFEHQVLRPRLHLEGYPLSPLVTPQKIQSLILYTKGGIKLMHKAITSTQGDGTKPKHKAKEWL